MNIVDGGVEVLELCEAVQCMAPLNATAKRNDIFETAADRLADIDGLPFDRFP